MIFLLALPSAPALAAWNTRYVPLPAPGAYVAAVAEEYVALVAGSGASSEIYLYDTAAETLSRVTTNSFEDRGAYLGQDGIYWTGWADGDWEIFFAPYTTLSVSQVTSNLLDDEWPVRAGSWLVWVQHDGTDLEVMARNLAGPSHIDVPLTDGTNQDADFGNLSTDGRYVAWHTLLPGPDREVRFCDMNTPSLPVFRIFDEGQHLGWVQVSGGIIALLGFGPQKATEVWAYRIPAAWGGDGDFRQISAPGVESAFPLPYVGSVTDGSHLVFLQGTAPATVVRLADLESGEVATISTTPQCREAQLAHGVACWLGEVDGRAQVFAYDVAAAEGMQLTSSTQEPYWLHTGDGVVAWTVHEGTTSGLYLASKAFPTRVFVDVSGGHRYREAIEGLYRAGVVSGTREQGAVRWFDPDQSLLRAQFAKMIVGTLPLTVDEGLTSPFLDLGQDDPGDLYPHEFIAAAYQHGVTRGATPEKFEPWANITRAQVVSMMVRGAESRWPGALTRPEAGEAASTLGAFDPSHADNMWTAEYNGILAGVEGFSPSWDPWLPASRGEMAQMLWNLWKLLPDRW